MFQRSGPMTDPCGTPISIHLQHQVGWEPPPSHFLYYQAEWDRVKCILHIKAVSCSFYRPQRVLVSQGSSSSPPVDTACGTRLLASSARRSR
ncbi:uncharacterized protein LOC143350740 isoform X2 [Colletes latitarsis]|uniref:uncharacterized protein LOC143341216 isoform X2 n=1 Tax=Colletes latitarsis TaxID=2605962 RepID=UPI00403751F9